MGKTPKLARKRKNEGDTGDFFQKKIGTIIMKYISTYPNTKKTDYKRFIFQRFYECSPYFEIMQQSTLMV